MYKILIVDDKALIRKGLQKMIKWEELDVQFIGEAENGSRALEIIKETEPHIVITDIRMPKTDGIELIKSVNTNYPGILTIVISGYDDFEYARQAIKNGSLDYILKPINPAELNDTIKKACTILDKNKKDDNKDKNISEYLLKLIHSQEDTVEMDHGDLFKMDTEKIIFSTVVLYDKYKTMNIKKLHEQLLTNNTFIHVLLIQDTNEILFVFYTEYNYKLQIFESKIYDLIENTTEYSEAAQKVIFSIGEPKFGLKSIKKSYETARQIILYGLLKKHTSIIQYSDTFDKKSYSIPLDRYEDELIINITSGNIDEVNKLLKNLMDDIFQEKDIAIDSIRLFLSNLCHILLKVDTDLSDDIQNFLIRINNLYYFLSFDTIDNVVQIIFNLFHYTTQKYMKKKNKKNTIIYEIKEFINKNYSNDIGLSQISELYHMNASYLSNLFKKETGENINQYITKVRITHAQRMLVGSDVNIKELADLVGYSDYTYFYKVFKKITGMTPKQYYVKNNK